MTSPIDPGPIVPLGGGALLLRVEQRRREQLLQGLAALFGEVEPEVLAEVEAAGAWRTLRRGERLFAQGDPGDGLFLLLSGRLRAVLEGGDAGEARILGDVAAGESVGEMAYFTGEPRSASVYAVRDSLVLGFSNEAFGRFLELHPIATTRVAKLVIDRYRRSLRPAPPALVTNIALLPGGDGVALESFADALAGALRAHGAVAVLDADGVDAALGEPGIARAPHEDPRAARLPAWMDEQERTHRFVVYRADPDTSPWTRRSLRQADHVLVVADAGGDPLPGAAEQLLAEMDRPLIAPRRTLLLVHPEGTDLPHGTERWLAPRAVHEHRHLRGASSAELAGVARTLAGRAIGLVMGGGGARGFAHIGVVRALREAGVPIDMVGGTSMGGAMAAQCAMGWTPDEMATRSRAAFVDLNAHREWTLPLYSLVRGRKARRMESMLYGDVRIEDLWIPFFCVSTDITNAEMRVHRSGPVGRAATASASLPGVITPVVDGGALLVDGAILNNVPADVMRQQGAGVVIVADVSLEDRLEVTCAEFPSPWSTVWSRLLRRPVPRLPNLMEVILRTTLLASTSRARLTRQQADFYLEPPLGAFGLMDFDALERVAAIGHADALERIAGWGGADAIVGGAISGGAP